MTNHVHERPPSDLTKNQKLVFDALSSADGPLSAYTILDQLRDEGFRAPLQVYRALEKLQELGLVHRLESLNGMIGFAICENCGQVEEFSDAEIETRLGTWMRERAFKPRKTTVELRGLCATCSTH
jgi:Fur family transcriptional regulator, zinc uptake regulator